MEKIAGNINIVQGKILLVGPVTRVSFNSLHIYLIYHAVLSEYV